MKRLIVLLITCFLARPAVGQVATGIRLYSSPDPDAPGGIRVSIRSPGKPLAAAFALPTAEPGKLYKATIGPDLHSFGLRGLPAAKYDLIVAFTNSVYEGLRLAGRADTLTENDRDDIADIIQRSEPYFNEKHIHRVEGTTGRMTGTARCFATFLRSKKSIGHIDGIWRKEHRRSLKLVLLEQVGPGWQIAKTREIYTGMVPPGTGRITAYHRACLSGIRVTDSVKDLGELELRTDE